MNRRKVFSILIALSLILITIPPTFAALDEWAISEADEDVFWATYQFDDVDLNYLQGDDMQIRGWYLFEGPDVLKWGYPISEAYLSLKSMGDATPDPDASMTLYIQPARKGGALSIYDDLDQINGPYDSNSVNVNLSSWVGGGVWHNITVTNMVRAVNQGYYFYDGHDIAFITLSTDNHDAERYVSSEETGNGAILYVHYETPDTPPGLPEGAEWIEDYRNYTIWEVPIYGNITKDYIFWREGGAVPSIRYDYIHAQPSEFSVVEPSLNDVTALYSGGQRQIVRTENGTLYVVFHQGATRKIQVENSIDEGATWSAPTILSTLAGMAANSQINARIAVDSNNTLHVVWAGMDGALRNIFYVNYTGSWSTPIGIWNEGNATAYVKAYPAIAIDEGDNVHVSWVGANLTYPTDPQIWYSNKTATSNWCNPIRVSTAPGMDSNGYQFYPTITCDSTNSTHIAWSGKSDSYPGFLQIWHAYTYSNNSWSDPVRVSTYLGMDGKIQDRPSIAVGYANDNAHLTWFGMATGYGKMQVWYTSFNGTWTDPIFIANGAGMTGQHQVNPTIAVYRDETINILWEGLSTAQVMYDCIFEREYDGSWGTVQLLQDEWTHDQATPNLAYNRFPEEIAISYEYFLVDENGTVVETWNGDNFTDADDLKDFVDDEVIGYPDPEDPSPPGWDVPGEGLLTRFNFKLIIFMIGMILFAGAPVYGLADRPEAATWIIIFFLMFIGVSLLWSLQTM